MPDDDIGLPVPPNDDLPAEYAPVPEMDPMELMGAGQLSGNPIAHLYHRRFNELGGRSRRKIAGNTYLENHNGTIAVVFHVTAIVQYRQDGSIRVNSGGWSSSPTTRARINDALRGCSWSIARRDGETIWFNSDTREGTTASSSIIPFTDGDIIKDDGTLVPQAEVRSVRRRPRRA